VDLTSLIPYFLFLHVFGAILAFGPTYAYSIMGSMAGKEPQHANFSSRQVEAIGNQLVYPLAIFQGITGVLLIIAAKIEPQKQPWLVAGIILYLIAITYALTVQRNALHHLIALTSTPPPPGTPPGPPPPEVLSTVKQIQRGGILLGVLVVVIVFLMVVKPGR
jgi:uncharacterized membrane protein